MADTNPLDAVPMKDTEYDFPQELLDAAQVARSERQAEQPKYNDDLAKVVARAGISESEARKAADAAEADARQKADEAEAQAREQADEAEADAREKADDALQAGKINALDGATDLDAATFAKDAAGKVSVAEGGIKKEMIDPDALASDDVVTIPKTENPGKNALDSDLFETQEVNGDVGVTLKQGAITNEYVGKDAIGVSNVYGWQAFSELPKVGELLDNSKRYPSYADVTYEGLYSYPGYDDPVIITPMYYPTGERGNYNVIDFDDGVLTLHRLMRRGTTKKYKFDIVESESGEGSTSRYVGTEEETHDFIAPYVLPYTNQINTFQYSTPTAKVGSITEKYNLADLGVLQIIVAQAQVTFTAAGTAFMTLTTDKIWASYMGVTDSAPATFQPFLIAESPANPTTVTSGLTHDSNGYRMQMQASAAGTYTLTYVLGNIAADRIETPFTW